MTPIEVTDGVVLLSTPTVADVDRITEMCQDADVARWTTIPSPYRRSDAEWFVSEMVERGWAGGTAATWAVRDPSTVNVCGMVGVDLAGDAEIGFWMGASSRGRGWTTRAARLAAAWPSIRGSTTCAGRRSSATRRRCVWRRGWAFGWTGPCAGSSSNAGSGTTGGSAPCSRLSSADLTHSPSEPN
jgi:hypothetical protein